MKPKFEVVFLEEANEFLNRLDEKAREKIIYTIRKSQIVNDSKLFKKLNNHVWEFRTLHNKIKYRLFAFWDKTDKKETVVVSTHGIEKKSQKISKSDIKRTERMMNEYFNIKK